MEVVHKSCTVCGHVKALEEFSKDKRNRSGRAARCKLCVQASAKKWAEDNRDRYNELQRGYGRRQSVKLYRRNWYLRKHHGVDHAWYESKLEAQGGVCAICGGPPNTKDGFFHIDHDHQTGKLRDLLCQFCNTGLGSMKEDEVVLGKAIEYLKTHRSLS